MTYATVDNLKTRFGEEEIKQLTDKAEPRTGAIVTAVVDKALADTDSEMNGYIAVKYALPVPSTVLILEAIASDIARFFLHENNATEEVEYRYEKRIDQLQGIASGKIKLVDSATGLVYGDKPTQVGSGPIYDGAALIFTDEVLDDY